MNKKDIMVKDPEAIVQEAKRRLVEAYDPLMIYLYGEYVYREPDKYSELGFAIIIPETDVGFYQRPYKAYDVLMDLKPANEVVVWTKAEFDDIKKVKTSFVYDVANQGRKIYDKTASGISKKK